MLFVYFRMILSNRRFRITFLGVALLIIILTVSTLGFNHLEAEQNLSLFDSLWLSVVTMTTVGYGDVAPKTPAGRVLAMTLTMSCGIGVMAYLVSLLATSVIEREAKLVNGQLELKCEDHILIINMQREEKIHTLIDELRKDNKSSDVPIVLIDSETAVCPDRLLKRKNFFYVKGNPLWNVTLERANAIKAKKAVIMAKDPAHMASDGITLQAAVVLKNMHKEAGSKIALVAEVVSDDSIKPLELIGVEKIICLETLLAPLLAQALKEESIGEGIS
jgi:voltage-gated potassium channel